MAGKEPVILSARVSQKTKQRLEKYCSGAIDGMKHIQEDVVEISITRFMDRAEELEKMSR